MRCCSTTVCPTTPQLWTDVPLICLYLLNFYTPTGLYLPRVKNNNNNIKYVWKISEMLEFYVLLDRKIIQIPEFLWYLPKNYLKIPEFDIIFARKNARILLNNCPKNIFFWFFRGGVCQVSSPTPSCMLHAVTCSLKVACFKFYRSVNRPLSL